MDSQSFLWHSPLVCRLEKPSEYKLPDDKCLVVIDLDETIFTSSSFKSDSCYINEDYSYYLALGDCWNKDFIGKNVYQHIVKFPLLWALIILFLQHEKIPAAFVTTSNRTMRILAAFFNNFLSYVVPILEKVFLNRHQAPHYLQNLLNSHAISSLIRKARSDLQCGRPLFHDSHFNLCSNMEFSSLLPIFNDKKDDLGFVKTYFALLGGKGRKSHRIAGLLVQKFISQTEGFFCKRIIVIDDRKGVLEEIKTYLPRHLHVANIQLPADFKFEMFQAKHFENEIEGLQVLKNFAAACGIH